MKHLMIIAFFSLLLLGGCIQHDEYAIGWIGALSGSATQWGEPALKAADIALEEINANGGVNGKNLRFIVEDSQSTGATTATAANKLINVDAVNILFTHSSTESIAAAPLAEEKGVILFASATSTPDLTDAGDYIFRVTPVNREGETIAENLDGKVALVTEQAKYTVPIRQAILDNYENVVLDEQFQPGEFDMRTLVLQIKEAEPDMIVLLPFDMSSMIDLIKQLKEQDVQAQIIGNAAFNTPDLMEELGDLSEGLKFSTLNIDETDPQVVSFVERYENLHGSIPNKAHTLDAATKVYIIADALEKCDLDNECIKNYLYSIENLETVSGILTIDENGDADKDFTLMTVSNGKIVFS